MRFNRIGLLASRELARLDRYHHRKTHSKKKKYTPEELNEFNTLAEEAVKAVQMWEGPTSSPFPLSSFSFFFNIWLTGLRNGLNGTLDLLEILDEPELLMHNHPNSKIDFNLLRERINADHYSTIDMFKVIFFIA